MKKLLVVLLALSVFGALAFADDAAPAKINIGGWGRMYVSPFTYNGTDSTVTAGPGWAGNGGRVSLDFSASTENIGFEWNPGVSNNSMSAVCDQAKIWVAPAKFLKIQLGKIEGDTLRGKIGDSGDVVATVGNDDFFTRFYPNTGMLLDITPVDGLYIGASIDAAQSGTPAAFPSVENAFKAVQVGFGYTIKDIGQARAQYLGPGGPKNSTADGVVEAAFSYTGTKGLLVDVGAKVPFNANTQDQVSAGATFDQDAMHIYGVVAGYFGGTADVNAKGTLSFYYDVAAPASAGLEVAFQNLSAPQIDVFPALKLGYSNGYLKVGFDATLTPNGTNTFAASLPVQLEYWF